MKRLGRAALLIDLGIVLGFALARALQDARGHRPGPPGPPGPVGPMGMAGPPGICIHNASKENVR